MRSLAPTDPRRRVSEALLHGTYADFKVAMTEEDRQASIQARRRGLKAV